MTTGFMPLNEVDQRANALGLSYGQYVAQYRNNEHIKKRVENVYRVPLDADGNPIKTPRKNRKHLQKCADKIVHMFGNGSAIDEMAEVLGVSEIEMARFIKQSGLTREECRAGTSFEIVQVESVNEKPCTHCKRSRCSDEKMCSLYKRWVAMAWGNAVEPFRKLQRGEIEHTK